MKIKRFEDLMNREVYEILKARKDVFMIGQGKGRDLKEGLELFARGIGCARLRCSAQVGSAGFYEKCGFRRVSEEYEEAGIPHVRMEKEL